ncbi:transcription initiation factor IIA subunit 1 [Protopterus annectens]|uniref:transcription initiation factor IIA subunit 1 n=1 Tax=Protopterus annectens TaxID=7888 RepID=UPI001CF93913|nr:transcription initiation factor IIA subunit 1 [Protopterus annectens]
MQSKAVDGFHSDEQQQQQLLHAQPQQLHHVAPSQQSHPQQHALQQQQSQQVLISSTQQAPQPQVIVQDSKLIQHMNTTGMVRILHNARLNLPLGISPLPSLFSNNGQILQVVRAANGAQYLVQSQQPVVLQQPVIPQMQPGVQAPVIQQVLAPISAGMQQQTGVIIQPQQIVISGSKVPPNAQLMQQTTVAASTTMPQGQNTAAGQHPPLMLQVDGTNDTSSEEDEDEEEDYDEDEDEEKEKDGDDDGQVEEEPLNSEDDVSDEDGQELFDTENVVVCQYDKIHRSKNKWKFHLKDGIMNLNGRDYVFSKAIGDAEW